MNRYTQIMKNQIPNSKEDNNGSDSDLEDIWQKIESLPLRKRLELGQRLLGRLMNKSGLTVVVAGNNVNNKSLVVQLSNPCSEIEKQLTDIPSESLGKLIEAIAPEN